jgi:predicted PurR-regulated permease PerM
MEDKISKLLMIFVAAALFVIVVAGMNAAASIINPFLVSVFLGILFSPLLFWLKRVGVPESAAVIVIVVGFLAFMLLFMIFMGRSLNSITLKLPAYQSRLAELTATVYAWLNEKGIDVAHTPLSDFITPRKVMNVFNYGLSILSVLLTNMFLIVLTVLFILLEVPLLPRKLQMAFPDSQGPQSHFKTFAESVNRYIGFKALFSAATGVSIWALLTLIGVEFAGTWGLLAFLLNFIPSIGSIIAAFPAILWALLQINLSAALWTLLAYLFVNIVIGSLLEPRFIGQSLGLSTLVVFLSMIFWGWVLGPIGMVLSVPLTMVVKLAFASDPRTRWAAIMLE